MIHPQRQMVVGRAEMAVARADLAEMKLTLKPISHSSRANSVQLITETAAVALDHPAEQASGARLNTLMIIMLRFSNGTLSMWRRCSCCNVGRSGRAASKADMLQVVGYPQGVSHEKK